MSIKREEAYHALLSLLRKGHPPTSLHFLERLRNFVESYGGYYEGSICLHICCKSCNRTLNLMRRTYTYLCYTCENTRGIEASFRDAPVQLVMGGEQFLIPTHIFPRIHP